MKLKRTIIIFACALVMHVTSFVVAGASTVAQYDVNGDGVVQISDAVLLNHYIAEDFSVVENDFAVLDVNSDGFVDVLDTVDVLKYLASEEEDIKPTETTTTTTMTTTTTTTTETTTTTQQTTTTTTVTTPQIDAQYVLLHDILNEMSVTDTTRPVLNDVSYEFEPYTFLFEKNNIVYAYSVGTKGREGTNANAPILLNRPSINAIHIWKYEGEQVELVNITDELPNTEGKTFVFRETEYEYALVEYSKLTYLEPIMLAEYLVGERNVNSSSARSVIQRYDYNLSGTIDEEDIKIMITYMTSDFCTITGEDPVFSDRYFNAMDTLQHENVVYHLSSELVNYSYRVPCTDYYEEYEGVTWMCPVQVLPTELSDEVMQYEEDNEVSDSVQDYIMWRPEVFGHTGGAWASYSEQFEHWLLASFYVQVVTSSGDYLEEWQI